MPLTVLSPYSGRPVKVRDQDVGRAVRDEEKRVFYVVARPEEAPVAPADAPSGGTHYASLTRHGSEKDLARYDALVTKGAVLEEHRTETAPARPVVGSAAHDATGKKRSPLPRLVVLLLSLIAIGFGVKFGWDALSERELLPAPPWSDLDLPGPEDVPGIPGEPILPDLDPPEGTPDLIPDVSSGIEASPFGTDDGPRVLEASVTVPDLKLSPNFEPSEALPDLPASTLAGAAFDFTETASGLRYRVDRHGHGPKAQVRDYAVVRYAAYHAQSGLEVDATPEGEPLGFVLWAGQVFRGLDEGVAGMRVGEKRTLLVPVHLTGVGAGAGVARAAAGWDQLDAALRVEVELVNVLPGLRKRVLRAGSGRFAGPGDSVKVHWTMFVGHGDGDPVIDSRRFGGPVGLTLGAGEVIAGLELGIVGMAEGERSELRLPPYLAYGADGAAGGLIPPHATVRCVVELLAVDP
ncbi:MAG: FKBP-type peptidyl-prolyl cis-trans isomerase [Planctomycetota bacterium]